MQSKIVVFLRQERVNGCVGGVGEGIVCIIELHTQRERERERESEEEAGMCVPARGRCMGTLCWWLPTRSLNMTWYTGWGKGQFGREEESGRGEGERENTWTAFVESFLASAFSKSFYMKGCGYMWLSRIHIWSIASSNWYMFMYLYMYICNYYCSLYACLPFNTCIKCPMA